MIDASPEAQQRHGQVGAKRELWRTLIFLALAAIAIELFIATPSGNTISTAEHAITLMMSLARKIPQGVHSLERDPQESLVSRG